MNFWPLLKRKTLPVVAVFADAKAATYNISFAIPLIAMTGKTIRLKVFAQTELSDESSIKRVLREVKTSKPSCIVFSRFSHPIGLEIEKWAREHEVRTIYHIDDDLLTLPKELGPEVYARHQAQADVRRSLMAQSDSLYASTEFLAKRLKDLFPEKPVQYGIYCPNLSEIFPAARTAPRSEFTFGYMGSKGHVEDLREVLPAIRSFMDTVPSSRFELFGTIQMPEELKAYGDRVSAQGPAKSYEAFLQKLAGLGWHVGLAPLKNSEFNLCKAPTKYIEYTYAGIATLATDRSVYGVIRDGDNGYLASNEGFVEKLVHIYENRNRIEAVVAEAKRTCAASFPLSRLQNQLMTITGVSATSSPDVTTL